MLEELPLGPALFPRLLVLDGGYFLSYHDFATGQTSMRFSDEGVIQNVTTLDIQDILFAYMEAGLPHLVSQHFDINEGLYTNITTVYVFDVMANIVDTTVLRIVPLPAEEIPAGHAFHYSNGVLTVVAGTAVPGQPRNDFQVWITTYDGTSITNMPPWDPGPLPQRSFITQWGILRVSNGQFVMAVFVRGEDDRALWFMGLESTGEFNNNIEVEPIPLEHSVNGIQIVERDGSAILAFTENADNAEPSNGVQLMAFPLSLLLDADGERPELPSEISLAAFPNPFNPTSTIRFTLPESGDARLTVYDLAGRQVATLFQGALSVGNHEQLWDATNLASGKYFCRLATRNDTRVIPLILVK